jgi:putative membrane protein
VVRFVVPVPALALVAGLAAGSPWIGFLVLVVLAGPAVALGLARYRALGHATTTGTVVARSGALLHRTAFVPVARTQSHRVESSPFQRRSGLATLAIHVAGRGRTVWLVDLDQDRCRAVGDHALGSAEARRDELAVRRRTAGLLEGSVAGASRPRSTPSRP